MPKNKFQDVIFYDYHGICHGLCDDLLQYRTEHRRYEE